ncbi:glycerate kinase [Lapidilactobacillus achengensis]|uniref:Glycerate kinase n=1 Tax=Lapidilactobacillus achengensis TaxID=2486000 RepID=A0ABW1URH2_9LACO|nr:glycerate kinase [Lapidilactobacillus achengensis]
MKIVAAIDSFKGCATSAELNQAALAGLPKEIDTVSIPIADGGEGSLAVVQQALGGRLETALVADPLGRKICVPYLLTDLAGETTAVIEAAQVLGLNMITAVSDANARRASSFGLGELIRIVLRRRPVVQQIMIALGGSATSDGGLGLLAGLLASPETTFVANPLLQSAPLDLTLLAAARRRLAGVRLVGLPDVQALFSGSTGFAKVYATQKGASPQTIRELDQQATALRQQVVTADQFDLDQLAGSGAAGGLGGMIALLGGSLSGGLTTLASLTGLEAALSTADLVITGEGRIDAQTLTGKVPYGVARLAERHHVPVLALCGARSADIGIMERLTLGCFCIQAAPVSLADAIDRQRTLANVNRLTRELVQVFCARE